MSRLWSRIFNWKVVSIIYTLFYVKYVALTPINYNVYFSPFESLLVVLSLFSVMYILGICYAVGWKKRLFSPKALSLFTSIFLITTLLFAIRSIFDNIQYVENIIGPVLAIILSVIRTLLLNIPTVIAFFVYLKNINNYDKIEKPIYKMIISMMAFEFICLIIKCSINEHIFTNLFDYLSIIGGLIFIIYGFGYAWNLKIGTKPIIRTIAFYFIIISLMPLSLLSRDYLLYSGVTANLANPIGILYIVAQIAFQIFIVYRYAFKTDVVVTKII